MLRQRVLLYFAAVAVLTVMATVLGEVFLVNRVAEHSRRADVRFANSVAQHVSASLDEGNRQLLKLMREFGPSAKEQEIHQALRHMEETLFERGGTWVFTPAAWAVGAEASPGGLPPRQVLLPAIRLARTQGGRSVTSLWRGADGAPRVCLVAAVSEEDGWKAAVGTIRLEDPAFLSRFGFFLGDAEMRLQILDATGTALFSTLEGERYSSVVHGTYLLDRVRQHESAQVRCHACHVENGKPTPRQDEIATLAPVPGTSWSVLVRENPRHVQQVLIETVMIVLGLVCLILGAFTGFYWSVIRRVIRPLRQLASAAAAVNAATPSLGPPTRSRDEMQVLAASFESMLGQMAGGPNAPRPSPSLQTGSNAVPLVPLLPEAPVATAPQDLRERLRAALSTAANGFLNVDLVSAILIRVEGEALGDPPLVVGTLGAHSEPLARALHALGRANDVVTAEDLMVRGVDVGALEKVESFYRADLSALQALKGELWVGTSEREAARQVRPIAELIMLHLQGILDRSLLSDTLWQEYREKSRMLGHLFEAEAEERKRIAREIHDDTAQSLSALMLLLEAFPTHGTPEQQAAAIRTAQERTGRIIDSTDRIMKRLRPALLDDLGLTDAVRELGDNVLNPAGVDFDLDAPAQPIGAANEIEDAVFRVFQEASSNVVRHAHASNVFASIELDDGRIVASFEDDGRGMQPPTARKFSERPRFGLLGMRERIVQLGGDLKLSTAESGGVRIDLWVPFRPRQPRRTTSQDELR